MIFFRSSVIFLLSFILCKQVSSQHKEIFVTTDNDAYLLSRHDGYYTNGLVLGIRYPGKRDSVSLVSVGLRQDLFTPGGRDFLDSSSVDRPYAGHLYAWFFKQKFYQPDRFYYWKVQMGVIGRNSLGEGIQTALHRWAGLGQIVGWEYQIPNMFSITFTGGWTTLLYTHPSTRSAWKVIAQSELNGGTTYVNAKVGAYFVMGRINPLSSSSLFAGRSQAPNNRLRELFLFSYPSITWQGYDATIQGSWLKPSTVGITRSLAPVLFQHALGAVLAVKNYSLEIAIIHQTRAASSQLHAHSYGSLKLGILIKSRKGN